MNEYDEKSQPDLFHAMAGVRPLIKFDCPSLDCQAWFVSFDYARFLCVSCQQEMVATELEPGSTWRDESNE